MSHADNFVSTVRPTGIGHDQMRSKSQAAWETAARCATLAQEADDPKSGNIMHACGMRGSRWRKDASLSTFLM